MFVEIFMQDLKTKF